MLRRRRLGAGRMPMRIFTLIAVSVAILLVAATDTRAGQSHADTGYFNASGRVIDEATGKPISKIQVNLSTLEMPAKAPAEHPHGSQLVEGGEFRFTNLWRGGRYAVIAPTASTSSAWIPLPSSLPGLMRGGPVRVCGPRPSPPPAPGRMLLARSGQIPG